MHMIDRRSCLVTRNFSAGSKVLSWLSLLLVALCTVSMGCFPGLPDDDRDATLLDVTTADGGDVGPDEPEVGPEDVEQDAAPGDIPETDTDPLVTPPGQVRNVRASTNRSDGVMLEWDPVVGATTYRIHRGEMTFDRDAAAGTSWLDTDARSPDAYGAPTGLTASETNASAIHVSWTAPAVPVGPSERYKVQALNTAGSGELSVETSGNTVGSPVADWEVRANASAWLSTGSTATTFEDTAAPTPTVEFGTITASEGAHHAHVALDVERRSAVGVPVTYAVRGRLADGSYTPESGTVSGQRDPSGVTWSWAVADARDATAWTTTGEADDDGAIDTTAPLDGTSRFYRVEARVGDTVIGESDVVEGWRLAFVEVSGGHHHFCARTTRGRVWCWGDNREGQLGRGMTGADLEPFAPAEVDGLDDVAGLASGRYFNIAWKSSGETIAWGRGAYADGMTARTSANPVAFGQSSIALAELGQEMDCTVDTNGRARCWGGGGVVGDGTFENRLSATRVVLGTTGYLDTVTSISAGTNHSCAVTLAGTVHCWGQASSGRTGSTAPSASGFHLVAQPAVPDLSAAVAVAANSFASCAVLANGHVYCWGSADFGAVVTGATPYRVDGLTNSVTIVGSIGTFCALRENGTVWCWGGNNSGALGRDTDVGYSSTAAAVAGITGARSIGAGQLSSFCVVTEDYGVSCWGDNAAGKLGDNTTENRYVPVAVLFP